MLINLCNNIIDIKDELNDTTKLSRYAIAKRYPGEYQAITKEDAKEAVHLAELTKKVINRLLKEDGIVFRKPTKK